jgi:hypothetical protein
VTSGAKRNYGVAANLPARASTWVGPLMKEPNLVRGLDGSSEPLPPHQQIPHTKEAFRLDHSGSCSPAGARLGVITTKIPRSEGSAEVRVVCVPLRLFRFWRVEVNIQEISTCVP